MAMALQQILKAECMEQKYYFPGDILEVNMRLYTHVGIADWNGNVISASRQKGEVVCESVDEFSGGRKVVVNKTIPKDNATVAEAISSAENLIGKKYNLFFANCEHLVRYVYNLPIESPQAQKYALRTLGIGALASNNPSVRAMGLGASIFQSFTPKDESPIDNALTGAIVGLGLALLFGGND